MDAVSVAMLKAVAPPLLAVLTLVPPTPDVWSQARNVIAAVPLKSALGRNRTRFAALDPSRSDEVPLTVPTAVQPPPPSVEYCQVPLAPSAAVIAMPATAPASTSVM